MQLQFVEHCSSPVVISSNLTNAVSFYEN